MRISNKDDDESDKYPGVPKGSIVPIEERAFVLTGADKSGIILDKYPNVIFEFTAL